MTDHAKTLADIATVFWCLKGSRGYWLILSGKAEALANKLPAGEAQDEARHYAIQSAFRAHDGKRAWELSKGWGLTGATE